MIEMRCKLELQENMYSQIPPKRGKANLTPKCFELSSWITREKQCQIGKKGKISSI